MIALLTVVLVPMHSAYAQADSNGNINFAIDIQPILAQRCYKCHGSTAAEAGLRLNTRDAAVAKLESGGHAVIPGKIDASTILQRLRSTDDDQRMPPEGKPLSEEQIAKIESWIQQGADWAEHWGFQKPVRPAIPDTSNSAWAQNPIDAFILATLDAAALTPAAAANKVTLIRRAYYDLIGLPPTTQQVDEFLADRSKNAYERIIDRLLESDQYGEKWARHWLDLVRYAETNGYERDGRKELIWKYRDYVIQAFNEDKPFDRFVQEQLAGDELADVDAASITATGVYRLGLWDDEPADRELSRYDYLDDILRTTSETFLGMTVGCARCHDHKIDPIAQKDYYTLLAFFSDITPHGGGASNHVPISKPEDKIVFEAKVAQKKQRKEALEQQISLLKSEFLVGLMKKYPKLGGKSAGATLPEDGVLISDSIANGQDWIYTTDQPADHWFEIAFDAAQWRTGLGGFGTKGTPGAVVRTEWRSKDIWLRKDFRLAEIPDPLSLKIHHDEDATVYLNGKQIASLPGYGPDYVTIDVTEKSLNLLQTGRNVLAIHCSQTGGGQYIDAGLSTDRSATPAAMHVAKFGEEILGKDKLQQWSQLRQELTASRDQQFEYKTDFAMAVRDQGPHKTWILGRGSPEMKGDEVQPAFPGILNPPAPTIQPGGAGSSGKRRALAEWVASSENPMTARVMVNRIWQHHFGRGIVRSTSDFGYQGIPPTHPELLNWLAADFVDHGWKMKRMHKLMMMSATYQMSSRGNDAAIAKDPVNDLFWRFNMRRLTAEEIRDSILFVNDTLNAKMFGASVFPPLPAEVLATSSTPGSVWGNSTKEDAVRRSIYVHVKRSLRVPMLESFDAPDPDTTCAARVATTVPTQALGMLNSLFITEQATKLAARLEAEAPNRTEDQIKLAIRLTTSRSAKPDEVHADLDFIQKLQRDEQLNLKQAMQNFCLLILNTNEFFYLD